ncbi:bifunctional folylpolyglutamate synthase/dihydrofolate synthase [Geomonas sp. RF6]|uniref:bifunctional folylpolyglutamate synthase/dihydrofolate synthase n=1 Tax=Geomonas sp. RF6 TaxID=2897342 RepID=UPI001E647362|nr:folylpolyglutamate synthase/dihydrofolate synthase family protein [Geomonas sp. RF6]UFS71343.1 bifunctional folylpolyglutamate synthase/dihydrofolate synthase [Geomonas sp. RF6]
MTYEETLAHIYALGRFGIKPGLDRITRLLQSLGNPQDAYRVVHVAGTNGKGSTASFLSSIMSADGYRTGLFTSPHLISFTERIRVDGAEIARERVAGLAQTVMDAAPEGSTFFEIVTAMAALYFAQENADLAVFEVGMGGRLDASNALQSILSVITPVSMDHREYLGDSLDKIAAEKAGICRRGVPLVCARQHPAALRIIMDHARVTGSPLYLSPDAFDARWEGKTLTYRGLHGVYEGIVPGSPGRYQSGNVACAVAAAELLSELGFPLLPEAVYSGVAGAVWPGRMELFPGPPRVLLDGAHNPAGTAALADALGEMERDRLFLVLGVMGDKDLIGMLEPLLPLADGVFTVAPALERASDPAILAEFCRERGVAAQACSSVADGISEARATAREGDLIVICGSLFTVGEARGILLSRRFEPFRG